MKLRFCLFCVLILLFLCACRTETGTQVQEEPFSDGDPSAARMLFSVIGETASYVQSAAVTPDDAILQLLLADGTLCLYYGEDGTLKQFPLCTDGAVGSQLVPITADMARDGVFCAVMVNLTDYEQTPVRYVQQLRLYDRSFSLLYKTDFTQDAGLLRSPVFSASGQLEYLSPEGDLFRLETERNITYPFSCTGGMRLYPGGLLLCTDGQYHCVTEPDAAPEPASLAFTGQAGQTDVYVIGNMLFYYRNGALYRYDYDSGTSYCIADLSASGFPGLQSYDLFVLNEEHVLVQVSDSTNGVTLYRMTGHDIAERIPIRVVCGGGTAELAAAEFNRTQGIYRIDIERYDSYAASEQILDTLDADILAGRGADVYILPPNDYHKMNNYAEKGLFCDLYPLFSDDSILSQDNLFPAVRSFFEQDGNFYFLSPYLQLQTMITSGYTAHALTDSTVGGRTALAAEQNAELTERCERDWALPYIFAAAQSDFADIKTGDCRFSSDAFVSLLEWVQTLDPFARGMLTSANTADYRDGGILFYPDTVKNLSQCLYYRHLFGTDDVVFVGFPHESGCGTVMEPMGGIYAISAQTDMEIREAAAEFVLLCFAMHEKNNAEGMIPVTVSGFTEALEAACERYYAYSYTSSEYRSSIEPISMDESIGVAYRMTDEDASPLYRFLTEDIPCRPAEGDVLSIVAEEISYVFGGVRDVVSCAEILQGRLSIYYSEKQ